MMTKDLFMSSRLLGVQKLWRCFILCQATYSETEKKTLRSCHCKLRYSVIILLARESPYDRSSAEQVDLENARKRIESETPA